MSKKYVVSIMDRHYIGDGCFLFSVNHTELGEIDDKTEIFKDRNGVEYAPMLAPKLLESEIPYAYSNIIELSKLPESVGPELSLREAISEFDYLSKQLVFIVGRTHDGKIFCYRIDKEAIRQSADGKRVSSAAGEEVKSEEELDQEYDETIKSLEVLKARIKRGDFNAEELKQILDNFEQNVDRMTEIIDILNSTMEPSSSGKNGSKQTTRKKQTKTTNRPQTNKQPNQQSSKGSSSTKIDIDDLHKKVTASLIAQDEPARRVIAELARKDMNKKKKKQGLLLTGPTGVGKTYLMSLIAKHLGKPFIKIDSTQITVPGFTGKDIEEKLWELYLKCGRNKQKAEEAIVFFDEIDKKGSPKKSDVNGQGVLNVLLSFIEGTTYDATPNMQMKVEQVPINTSNMTVILGGAFSDVYKSLKENNQMGFGGVINSKSKPRYREATTQDFIEKAQMTDEFMGRVTVIKLNDLDVEDIKRVMLESDESAMKVQEDIFRQLGTKITFTDSFISKVAQKSFDKKSGARGIEGIVDTSTWKAFDEVYSHPDTYEEVIIDEATVDNPSNYQLVKKIGNQQ